jgi:hypothetical protein
MLHDFLLIGLKNLKHLFLVTVAMMVLKQLLHTHFCALALLLTTVRTKRERAHMKCTTTNFSCDVFFTLHVVIKTEPALICD